ncbi:hypothetical protein [Gordonia hongkongensis]|uniref:Uncharacterized protein n=1 Tax=Gordonia hongkongensis TaxID=1701090 RepID=A0ABT6BUV8_9ACTN|nr:hypothetical protein [Gordonia hongkongensis]MDF6101743.1 hypothetical protein [Gordonia hongkongensis]
MPRRAGGSSELRDLLAAHHAFERERWDVAALRNWERHEGSRPRPEPRAVGEFERALAAGEDVAVSSGQLFRDLLWAGRAADARRYGWNGPGFGACLIVRGAQIVEVVAD